MNRSKFRYGTKVTFHKHFNYIADSVDQAMRDVLADYLAISPDFYIEGAVLTIPDGGVGTYSATAGSVCYKGEVMAVEAQSVLCPVGNVVFWQVADVGVDEFPVLNLDGQVDYVMRKRTAVLTVAPVYPGEYMALGAPRKADLDKLRFKGRLVLKGTVMPYAGSLDNFGASGLGNVGSIAEGWAICNGLNGTIDLRGLTPFMATTVPASGAPAPGYAGIGASSSPGDVVGSDVTSVEADNLPEHTHNYGDRYQGYSVSGSTDGSGGWATEDHTRTSEPNTTAHAPLPTKPASMAMVFIQCIAD